MKKTTVSKEKKPESYVEAIGRRKTARARVRIYPNLKKLEIEVNGKVFTKYFPLKKEHQVVSAPFNATDQGLKTTVKVQGGGLSAQAEAVRLGIARALVFIKPESRSKLKALGFLRRDPRMVERKKYGSRKARRPQQWRKR